ncbi:hypothetical protein ACJX0J_040039, partial [Zea mays]
VMNLLALTISVFFFIPEACFGMHWTHECHIICELNGWSKLLKQIFQILDI